RQPHPPPATCPPPRLFPSTTINATWVRQPRFTTSSATPARRHTPTMVCHASRSSWTSIRSCAWRLPAVVKSMMSAMSIVLLLFLAAALFVVLVFVLVVVVFFGITTRGFFRGIGRLLEEPDHPLDRGLRFVASVDDVVGELADLLQLVIPQCHLPS